MLKKVKRRYSKYFDVLTERDAVGVFNRTDAFSISRMLATLDKDSLKCTSIGNNLWSFHNKKRRPKRVSELKDYVIYEI